MALSGIPGGQKRAGDQDTGDDGEMPCVVIGIVIGIWDTTKT